MKFEWKITRTFEKFTIFSVLHHLRSIFRIFPIIVSFYWEFAFHWLFALVILGGLLLMELNPGTIDSKIKVLVCCCHFFQYKFVQTSFTMGCLKVYQVCCGFFLLGFVCNSDSTGNHFKALCILPYSSCSLFRITFSIVSL